MKQKVGTLSASGALADFKGKEKVERKLQWAATQCFFLTIFLGKTF